MTWFCVIPVQSMCLSRISLSTGLCEIIVHLHRSYRSVHFLDLFLTDKDDITVRKEFDVETGKTLQGFRPFNFSCWYRSLQKYIQRHFIRVKSVWPEDTVMSEETPFFTSTTFCFFFFFLFSRDPVFKFLFRRTDTTVRPFHWSLFLDVS